MSSITKFHYKNGVFFEKTQSGDVHISIMKDATPSAKLLHQIKVDHNSWLSIIAHCSKEGESSQKYDEAKIFHNYNREEIILYGKSILESYRSDKSDRPFQFLKCFIDGNALCIVKPDFNPKTHDIQTSQAMFIDMTKAQVDEFQMLSVIIKGVDVTPPTTDTGERLRGLSPSLLDIEQPPYKELHQEALKKQQELLQKKYFSDFETYEITHTETKITKYIVTVDGNVPDTLLQEDILTKVALQRRTLNQKSQKSVEYLIKKTGNLYA